MNASSREPCHQATSGSSPQPLPQLSLAPTTYPGCCLALSEPLLSYLQSVLPPPPKRILSIGSGYGLLESFLCAAPFALHVTGIEVLPSPNRFLPSEHHLEVTGSRFLEPTAAFSAAWLFVYPRRVGLVAEYLRKYGDAEVESIIWAGPKADWEDYKSCFCRGWNVEVRSADEVGGKAWEMFAVARKAL